MTDDPTKRKLGETPTGPGYRAVGDGSSADTHRQQGDPGYRAMGQPRPSSAIQRQESRESAPYVTDDFNVNAKLNALTRENQELRSLIDYVRQLIPAMPNPPRCPDHHLSCGQLFTGLTSDPTLKYFWLGRNPPSAGQIAAIPIPQPPDREYYLKSETVGVQHAWLGG